MNDEFYKDLPEAIQESIKNFDYIARVQLIGGNMDLTLDKIDDLELLTKQLMVGTIKKDDFVKAICTTLDVKRELAERIAFEINDQIIEKIKTDLVSKTSSEPTISNNIPTYSEAHPARNITQGTPVAFSSPKSMTEDALKNKFTAPSTPNPSVTSASLNKNSVYDAQKGIFVPTPNSNIMDVKLGSAITSSTSTTSVKIFAPEADGKIVSATPATGVVPPNSSRPVSIDPYKEPIE